VIRVEYFRGGPRNMPFAGAGELDYVRRVETLRSES
jgi:hypothetical protein